MKNQSKNKANIKGLLKIYDCASSLKIQNLILLLALPLFAYVLLSKRATSLESYGSARGDLLITGRNSNRLAILHSLPV